MQRYNPKDIEPKWQQQWEKDGVYTIDLNSAKPKYYGFAMFNYPSGNSIHVGHGKNFTLPDVLTRAKRQQGFESYMPVGFDSFGLAAENFAIRTGTPPRQTTDKAIATIRTQYKAMGWGMDWSREIDSSTPEYYRWTQWCFLKLLEHNLAYQKESAQWWCSLCKTVLADEQVIAGKCWRHEGADDPLVSKKSLRQWFFRVTDYADEILEATDALDWTPWVKTAQKNWIGRKSGIEITYQVEGVVDENITCFTTRPDTNFGATFIVIAPEHPFAQRVMKGELAAPEAESTQTAVAAYIEQAMAKSDLDRQKEGRTKTGVFTGFYAHNALNGRQLPIWVSDFVLAGFGTGAVVGVPGHDLRDFEFAAAFDLPIERVVVGPDGDTSEITRPEQVQEKSGVMTNSDFLDGLSINDATEKMMDYMEEHQMGKRVVNYSIRDWLISRQRYWGAPIPIVHCETCGAVPLPEDQLPLVLPEIADYHPSGDGRSPLAKLDEWVNVPCPKCGQPGKRETDTMDGYVCSSWYFLRYLNPHDDTQAWDSQIANKWMPVDFYNGGDHATAHLIYARFFTRFFHKLGLVGDPEPFGRMYFHAKFLASDGSAFSKSKGNGADPLDIIEQGYGADALRVYICFVAQPDVEAPWNEEGIPACYRFLNRFYTLVQEYLQADSQPGEANEDILRSTHRAIKKTTEDIEAVKFNTALAALMECVNDLYKIKAQHGFTDRSNWQFALESLTQLLAPFAPHLAEEVWHLLGHEDTVHINHWPQVDEKYLVDNIVTLGVQVNGKVRGEVTFAAETSAESVLQMAKEQPGVQRYIEGKQIKKEIYIPGRIISLVVA